MQIRIGIRDVAREITLDSSQQPEQLREQVGQALTQDQPLLELEDERGNVVLVPTQSLAYLELDTQSKGKVGFGRS